MFDLVDLRPIDLNFATKDANQSSVTENAVFLYTAIVQIGSQRK